MSKCSHEKIYANWQYATNPPQTPWVCKKCGEKGVHIPDSKQYQETYEDIIKKFKENRQYKFRRNEDKILLLF